MKPPSAEATREGLAYFDHTGDVPPETVYSPEQLTLMAAAEAWSRMAPVLDLVDEQAEDEGLWFNAITASEAYLQQELRRLHAAMELVRLAEGSDDAG